MEAEPTAAGEIGFSDPVVPVSSYRDYMSEQSPAVFISHPPEALLRLVNPAMGFLLGTPLAGAARKQMTVVSFKAAQNRASHRCAESYGVKRAQRMMGLGFRDDRVPTLEEFREAAQRDHMAAVKLSPAG